MKNLICLVLMLVAWNVWAEVEGVSGFGKWKGGLCFSTNTKISPNPAVLESVKKLIASIREEEASRIKMLDRLAELESKVEWIMERQMEYSTNEGTMTIKWVPEQWSPYDKEKMSNAKSWKELYEGGK